MSLEVTLDDLNEDQRRILETKRLDGKYKPKQLVKLLRNLVSYDRANDEERVNLKRKLALLAIPCLVTFFAFVILLFKGLSENNQSLIIFASLAGVSFGILMLISRWLKKRISCSKETDLSNEVRRVLFPFALIMEQEALPNSKLTISLDANKIVSDEYKVETVPSESFYGRVTENYLNNWLSAEVVLVDNSLLQLKCHKSVSKIKIIKRNASGNIKHKTKIKSRDDVAIKLRLPRDRYTLSDASLAETISVQEIGDYIAVRGKYKFKTLAPKTLQVQTVLHLIHQMYSTVTPR